MKTYYTKTEEGSYLPATITQNDLAEILCDIAKAQLQAALTDKIDSLIDGIDLSGKVEDAISNVDCDDLAHDAVRDEIERRVENLDISVDVSI